MVTEADVRESLRAALMSSPTAAATVYEFWVPQSNERADVAVIGVRLDGFEIKTERDSLKRLPRQADAYGRVFDRCHAVLARRHLDRALDILPPWWGVQVIDEGLSFPTVRLAGSNDGVDPETLVRLPWRDEAYAALCELGEPPDSRAGRFRLWEILLAVLDVEGIKRVVSDALLVRRALRPPNRTRCVARPHFGTACIAPERGSQVLGTPGVVSENVARSGCGVPVIALRWRVCRDMARPRGSLRPPPRRHSR